MKFKITFFLLWIFTCLNAQITITQRDMPAVNDTLRFSNTFMTPRTDSLLQLTGEDIEWDFSHLRPTGQDVKRYERALTTPYGIFFIGFGKYGVKEADSIGIAQFQFEDVYQYFQSNNNSFQVEGIGLRFQGIPIPAFYLDNDELYLFPLDFEDIDSTTFSFQLGLDALGASYESVGYRKNEVDGYGIVTTPYGTFDCLRVKSTISSIDSISFGGFTIGLPNNRMEYKWLANGEKIPILEVSGNLLAERFIPTQIRYRDIYRTPEDFTIVQAPDVGFEADNLTPFVADTVQFSSSSSLLAVHAWLFDPSTVEYVDDTNSSSRNPKVVFTEPGLYDVSLAVTNTFGTADTTKMDYIAVGEISSTNLTLPDLQFSLTPNPAMDRVILTYELPSASRVKIVLLDAQGKLIKTVVTEWQTSGLHAIGLNMQGIVQSSGLYFLQLQLEQTTITQPVVFGRR